MDNENAVGYSSKKSGADNNFLTISFALVGYNTADIQQIKLSDGGAGGIGWGSEMFSVWEGLPTVVDGSEFVYFDPSMDPSTKATDYYWGDAEGNPVNYSIAQGQAVVVNCASDLDVTFAGQVPTGDVEFTSIADNNFTGNPFPAEIDIQNISLSDGGAGSIGWGSEMFSIWEGLPTVAEGSEFVYFDPSMDPDQKATGYYWGDAEGHAVTYPISVGKGVVINCAEGLTIKIKAPYSL